MDFIRPVQAARRRTDMERLTYDFALGGNHCWQVKGADNLECREVCERQGDDGCKTCPIAKAFDRLAAIEDILWDEYELDRLMELVEADGEGKVPKYTVGDTIYDRFGNKWEVDSAELHRLKRNESPKWLYRCGRAGTEDYCALWEFEAFQSREAALRREQDG